MKKLPLRYWQDFFSELAWLLKHGIVLQAAFHILIKQQRLKPLQPFIYHCIHVITQGKPLSHALMLSPQSYLFEAFVICGETSGTLDDALQRCSTWLSQTLHFHTQCRALLFYPCLLILMLLGGSTLLVCVIVPEFYALYQAFDAPIPSTLHAMWQIHLFLIEWGFLLGMGIVLFLLTGVTMTTHSVRIQQQLELLLLRLPIAKQLVHAHEAAHLGMLISGGIPIYQAFQVVSMHTRFLAHQDILNRLLEMLSQGQTLAQAYLTIGWHDAYLCDMLRVAQHTGTLDQTYLKLSDYYTHQLDRQIQRFKQEWQPMLMLAMGILVGIWVFLLYYPLIQLGYAVG